MKYNLRKDVRRFVEGTLERQDALERIKAAAAPAGHFESAAREVSLDLCDTSDDVVKDLKSLIELVLVCSEQELCSADLPLAMLEEMMDTQTISGCDTLFTFLESHRKRMTARMTKGQALLRLCNELLRRLSKTEDTVFCGRILIFLSLVFPLSERSAVNLRGECNVDNVTVYEEESKSETRDGGTMQIDSEQGLENLGGIVVDDIYETFWSLQKYFANPPQVIAAPLHLTQFRIALSLVVEALEKIESASFKHDTNNDNGRSVGTDAQVGSQEVRGYFTPKMLTSKKLLQLELADMSFRRQICVQMLIMLDYLLGLTAANKELWDKGGPVTNKSLQTNYILPAADADWAKETRARVTAMISSSSVGAQFLELVEQIMKSDQAWLRWKCSGCSAYDVPPISTGRIQEAPRKIAILTAAKKPYQHKVGNAVLSKLWHSAGEWSDQELHNSPAYV